MEYYWNLLSHLLVNCTRPKLLHRIVDNQFICANQEVWNYNIHKPKGQRWEFYYSFTYEN